MAENQINTLSLQPLFYKTMAIVKKEDFILLTPNELLTLKTGIILPPPGKFAKEQTC